MEMILLTLRGFAWTAGNWVLIVIGMATATQLALWLGIASAAVQFCYTSYKWGKEIYSDYRSGKKKIPFKRKG